MSAPFYVSPEQLMKDRAEFARKGIARGRSVVVLRYDDGILLLAENPSATLHKIAEIYDRIAFAAVGKYNEFETLRQAGVRYADLRGYSYDSADVTARGLTNAYAQTLASVFTTESKPFEVELVVAEIGEHPSSDRLFRLSYDGSVADENEHVAIGGQAEEIGKRLSGLRTAGKPLAEVLAIGHTVLGTGRDEDVDLDDLEAAVLERSASSHRTFRRLQPDDLRTLLAAPATGEATGSGEPTTASGTDTQTREDEGQ